MITEIDISKYLTDGGELLTDEQITAFNPWFTANYYAILKSVIEWTKLGRIVRLPTTPDMVNSALQNLVNTFFKAHAYEFEKSYNSTVLVYEMLANRTGEEHKTETHSGEDNTNATFTPATQVTNSQRAFDDNSMTEVNKSVNSGTDTNNSKLQYGHSIVYDSKYKELSVLPQDVIEKEREIAKFSYVTYIADLLTNYLCVSEWRFYDE